MVVAPKQPFANRTTNPTHDTRTSIADTGTSFVQQRSGVILSHRVAQYAHHAGAAVQSGVHLSGDAAQQGGLLGGVRGAHAGPQVQYPRLEHRSGGRGGGGSVCSARGGRRSGGVSSRNSGGVGGAVRQVRKAVGAAAGERLWITCKEMKSMCSQYYSPYGRTTSTDTDVKTSAATHLAAAVVVFADLGGQFLHVQGHLVEPDLLHLSIANVCEKRS